MNIKDLWITTKWQTCEPQISNRFQDSWNAYELKKVFGEKVLHDNILVLEFNVLLVVSINEEYVS